MHQLRELELEYPQLMGRLVEEFLHLRRDSRTRVDLPQSVYPRVQVNVQRVEQQRFLLDVINGEPARLRTPKGHLARDVSKEPLRERRMAHAGIVEQHELVHIGRLDVLPKVVARVGQAPVEVGVWIRFFEAIVVRGDVRGAAIAHEREDVVLARVHEEMAACRSAAILSAFKLRSRCGMRTSLMRNLKPGCTER